MDNLPQIVFFVFLILIILPFLLLILFIVLKSKKKAWKGEIVEKFVKDIEDFDTNNIERNYRVKVILENGNDMILTVDKGRYDEWNVGDKLEKESGEMWPKKL